MNNDSDKSRENTMDELSSIINSFVSEDRIRKNIKKFRLFNHWSDIVGPEIAKKTFPIKIFKGTLYIKVANPVWANELSLMSRQMLKKINNFTGEEEITGLKFRIK
jgi:predicted nucleic acid-binding Zn ribbon protein